jgi:uncharacterized pyridoxamine 5'-phosphate oxidase family protein
MKANPRGFLATVEGNKPHVRGLGLEIENDGTIVIQTWTIKDIHQQIVNNPEVEISFNSYDPMVQVRVSGRVEIVNDVEAKKKSVEARPFLKPMVEKVGIDKIALYRLKGKATVWTMDKNFEPKEYVQL